MKAWLKGGLIGTIIGSILGIGFLILYFSINKTIGLEQIILFIIFILIPSIGGIGIGKTINLNWSYTKKGALMGFIFGVVSIGLFFVGIPLAILPMYLPPFSLLLRMELLGLWIGIFLAPINYMIIGIIIGWLMEKNRNKISQ